jgi:hypothetical protein
MDLSSDDDSSIGSAGFAIAPAPIERTVVRTTPIQTGAPLTIDTALGAQLGTLGPLADGNADRGDEDNGNDGDDDDGEGGEGGNDAGSTDERGSTAARKRLWAGSANVVVAVRVRPLPDAKLDARSVVRVVDARLVVVLDPSKVREEKEDVLRAHRSRERR